jgi:hypothetical protein
MKPGKFIRLSVLTVVSVCYAITQEAPLAAEAVFLKRTDLLLKNNFYLRARAQSQCELRIEKPGRSSRQHHAIINTRTKTWQDICSEERRERIVAHLEDEDRESYTFRKDLFSPEEFTLKRNEVLFMAEKNPSGLQPDGEIGTDRVSLKWLPPYDPVKKYKLFIKKKQSDKYEPADTTGSTSATDKKSQQ